jgi:hypothetical protein
MTLTYGTCRFFFRNIDVVDLRYTWHDLVRIYSRSTTIRSPYDNLYFLSECSSIWRSRRLLPSRHANQFRGFVPAFRWDVVGRVSCFALETVKFRIDRSVQVPRIPKKAPPSSQAVKHSGIFYEKVAVSPKPRVMTSILNSFLVLLWF